MTGCEPWTIWKYDYYRGDSVCLFPSDALNCYPGFFPFEEDLKGMAGQGSSALPGCYSRKKVVGKSYGEAVAGRAPEAANN